jgi:hypothetical protein
MTDVYELRHVLDRALGFAFLQFSAVIYLCFLGLTVFFFRQRETAFGIICAVCAVLCFALPFGALFGLVFGWSRARRWGIRAFMSVFTLLVAVAILNGAALVALRQMSNDQLKLLFGLPR